MTVLAGVRLARHYRAWDRRAWPHATHGFSALKSAIPGLVGVAVDPADDPRTRLIAHEGIDARLVLGWFGVGKGGDGAVGLGDGRAGRAFGGGAVDEQAQILLDDMGLGAGAGEAAAAICCGKTFWVRKLCSDEVLIDR